MSGEWQDWFRNFEDGSVFGVQTVTHWIEEGANVLFSPSDVETNDGEIKQEKLQRSKIEVCHTSYARFEVE